jgi:succinylglutamic semialdehyde dehydrogenase
MFKQNFIKNTWIEGRGDKFISCNPATGEEVWQGQTVSEEQVNDAVQAAKWAYLIWSELPFERRLAFLEKFYEELKKASREISETISKETGKPLWESDLEVGSILAKLTISVEAYHERSEATIKKPISALETAVVRHRPHGVFGVLGPFNFPGHLPHGHIIPALLAGNTIVFKPNALTPLVAEKLFECWEKASLPPGVINLIQGDATTGGLLATHSDLDGLMFTGSLQVGQELASWFSRDPGKILALEMGGNNPLVVHNVKDLKAAVYHTLQSAYITAGQRCTCARRLIVTRGMEGEQFVASLIDAIKTLRLGPYTERPEPFIGPVISNEAANTIISTYEHFIELGAIPLVALKRSNENLPFLSPGLLDVSSLAERPDEEIFGPLLQLIWVDNFETALLEANRTRYGLAASLLCDDALLYNQFLHKVRAGIINWNRPTTFWRCGL